MESVYINEDLKNWIQKEFPDTFKEAFSNWLGRQRNWWARCLVLKGPLSDEMDPSTQVRYVLQYDHPDDDSSHAFI